MEVSGRLDPEESSPDRQLSTPQSGSGRLGKRKTSFPQRELNSSPIVIKVVEYSLHRYKYKYYRDNILEEQKHPNKITSRTCPGCKI
jgi:hypothetical protein